MFFFLPGILGAKYAAFGYTCFLIVMFCMLGVTMLIVSLLCKQNNKDRPTLRRTLLNVVEMKTIDEQKKKEAKKIEDKIRHFFTTSLKYVTTILGGIFCLRIFKVS